jgi:N-acetylmuramic acid 6-phosphate etherase
METVPITEQENPAAVDLDSRSTADVLRLMNSEDSLVAAAVTLVLPEISRAVEEIVARLNRSGRLFYVGTGTSGRLGILDASECPPTFGVPPELVQGIIAGGYEACYRAVEASEDDKDAAVADLLRHGVTKNDAVVGITASGRTPYTLGAVQHARALGTFTAAVTCVPGSPITLLAEVSIAPIVGPEVIAGSSRLKAGTAQKMVLNMISTATMIRLGYVSGNRMSHVKVRNSKLRERALRILESETGKSREEAVAILHLAEDDLPTALVMGRTGAARDSAQCALKETKGIVQKAIEILSK